MNETFIPTKTMLDCFDRTKAGEPPERIARQLGLKSVEDVSVYVSLVRQSRGEGTQQEGAA